MSAPTEIDQVFQALADPTRRRVVERLVSGPATTSELAEPFAMALPSFTQHLKLLEGAGLVTSAKEGRVRTYRLAPAGLAVADGWLAEQRRLWEQRLDQLDDLLTTLKEQSRQARRPSQHGPSPRRSRGGTSARPGPSTQTLKEQQR